MALLRRALFQCRNILSRAGSSYEGPGKSTVAILNKDPESGLLIDAYSSWGFKLNNGIKVLGPIILFPRSILSWKIEGAFEINRESLSLFTVIDPKPDVLIIGMGDPEDTKLSHEVLLPLLQRGINVEVLPTHRAAGTYNFLNVEGRNVIAALLPPYNFVPSSDDAYAATLPIFEGKNHL